MIYAPLGFNELKSQTSHGSRYVVFCYGLAKVDFTDILQSYLTGTGKYVENRHTDLLRTGNISTTKYN